ncbi:uncharacterized protein LOC101861740 [Aplysia californica]|uniref:Uncharacterized protein LOC101861740 n=1 Tax=Aplysia californica TaxID=6500 RepID=A0ABM0JUA4_APLCA|nr:uncharacterized protein LOC101861740 [Aplysia californica]
MKVDGTAGTERTIVKTSKVKTMKRRPESSRPKAQLRQSKLRILGKSPLFHRLPSGLLKKPKAVPLRSDLIGSTKTPNALPGIGNVVASHAKQTVDGSALETAVKSNTQDLARGKQVRRKGLRKRGGVGKGQPGKQVGKGLPGKQVGKGLPGKQSNPDGREKKSRRLKDHREVGYINGKSGSGGKKIGGSVLNDVHITAAGGQGKKLNYFKALDEKPSAFDWKEEGKMQRSTTMQRPHESEKIQNDKYVTKATSPVNNKKNVFRGKIRKRKLGAAATEITKKSGDVADSGKGTEKTAIFYQEKHQKAVVQSSSPFKPNQNVNGLRWFYKVNPIQPQSEKLRGKFPLKKGIQTRRRVKAVTFGSNLSSLVHKGGVKSSRARRGHRKFMEGSSDVTNKLNGGKSDENAQHGDESASGKGVGDHEEAIVDFRATRKPAQPSEKSEESSAPADKNTSNTQDSKFSNKNGSDGGYHVTRFTTLKSKASPMKSSTDSQRPEVQFRSASSNVRSLGAQNPDQSAGKILSLHAKGGAKGKKGLRRRGQNTVSAMQLEDKPRKWYEVPELDAGISKTNILDENGKLIPSYSAEKKKKETEEKETEKEEEKDEEGKTKLVIKLNPSNSAEKEKKNKEKKEEEETSRSTMTTMTTRESMNSKTMTKGKPITASSDTIISSKSSETTTGVHHNGSAIQSANGNKVKSLSISREKLDSSPQAPIFPPTTRASVVIRRPVVSGAKQPWWTPRKVGTDDNKDNSNSNNNNNNSSNNNNDDGDQRYPYDGLAYEKVTRPHLVQASSNKTSDLSETETNTTTHQANYEHIYSGSETNNADDSDNLIDVNDENKYGKYQKSKSDSVQAPIKLNRTENLNDKHNENGVKVEANKNILLGFKKSAKPRAQSYRSHLSISPFKPREERTMKRFRKTKRGKSEGAIIDREIHRLLDHTSELKTVNPDIKERDVKKIKKMLTNSTVVSEIKSRIEEEIQKSSSPKSKMMATSRAPWYSKTPLVQTHSQRWYDRPVDTPHETSGVDSRIEKKTPRGQKKQRAENTVKQGNSLDPEWQQPRKGKDTPPEGREEYLTGKGLMEQDRRKVKKKNQPKIAEKKSLSEGGKEKNEQQTFGPWWENTESQEQTTSGPHDYPRRKSMVNEGHSRADRKTSGHRNKNTNRENSEKYSAHIQTSDITRAAATLRPSPIQQKDKPIYVATQKVTESKSDKENAREDIVRGNVTPKKVQALSKAGDKSKKVSSDSTKKVVSGTTNTGTGRVGLDRHGYKKGPLRGSMKQTRKWYDAPPPTTTATTVGGARDVKEGKRGMGEDRRGAGMTPHVLEHRVGQNQRGVSKVGRDAGNTAGVKTARRDGDKQRRMSAQQNPENPPDVNVKRGPNRGRGKENTRGVQKEKSIENSRDISNRRGIEKENTRDTQSRRGAENRIYRANTRSSLTQRGGKNERDRGNVRDKQMPLDKQVSSGGENGHNEPNIRRDKHKSPGGGNSHTLEEKANTKWYDAILADRGIPADSTKTNKESTINQAARNLRQQQKKSSEQPQERETALSKKNSSGRKEEDRKTPADEYAHFQESRLTDPQTHRRSRFEDRRNQNRPGKERRKNNNTFTKQSGDREKESLQQRHDIGGRRDRKDSYLSSEETFSKTKFVTSQSGSLEETKSRQGGSKETSRVRGTDRARGRSQSRDVTSDTSHPLSGNGRAQKGHTCQGDVPFRINP